MVQEFLQKAESYLEHLRGQMQQIRTGRAQPSLVENLMVLVESYGGAKMQLKELASISAPDASLLVVQPYDRSVLKDVEKALSQNELGLSPTPKNDALHIVIPPLTQERRQQFVKMVHDRTEDARVAIRNLRTDIKKDIESLKGEAGISEDDIKRQVDELQKAVEGIMDRIDVIAAKKEEELMEL